MTDDVDAEDLHARAAEAGIHRIAVPTPFAVGRVNCWLIEDSPLTLVDVGPNSARSLDVLERGLARFGHRLEDLELIVLSHQHLDHTGLAGLLAERSGAEVAALGALSSWLGDHGKAVEEDDIFATEIMREHGIPDDVRLALRGVSASFRGWGGSVDVTRPLDDGSVLRLRDRELHVHHRPGHSPSDVVLHDRSRGILIAADHLIRHISSNPLISRPLGEGPDAERPHALEIYLASMQRTQAMEDVSLVLTGHGDPISDPVALIDERFRGHDRRKAKILGLIREQPRTAHEIAGEIWGDVAVTQAYLTLSEVIGHVDLLVARRPRRGAPGHGRHGLARGLGAPAASMRARVWATWAVACVQVTRMTRSPWASRSACRSASSARACGVSCHWALSASTIEVLLRPAEVRDDPASVDAQWDVDVGAGEPAGDHEIEDAVLELRAGRGRP